MVKLGNLYETSRGNLPDYHQALQWYQKAANGSRDLSPLSMFCNWDAMNKLGRFYEKGLGVVQDYAQARQWYQKAADTGSTEAMRHLGNMYELGLGVPKDPQEARRWYRKAAAPGKPGASPITSQSIEQLLKNQPTSTNPKH